jgi:hypothetical protein
MSTEALVTSTPHFTKDTAGRRYAHVLAKRTYRLPQTRAPEVAPEQLAVVRELLHYGGDEENPVEYEPDFFACPRGGTDVLVQGSAFSPRGPCRELTVSVAVQRAGATREEAEKAARRIRVFGDRTARFYAGSISFSDPQHFEVMPLSYTRAYGGRDRVADVTRPDDFATWMAKLAEEDVEDLSPYEYPRNPLGRGYLVYPDTKAVEGAVLPNLEMLQDLLTPERLVLGSAERWPAAPRPAGFDWTGQDWFPRAALMGVAPTFEGRAEDVPEAKEGYLPAALLEGDVFDHLGNEHSPRFFHGAPPWMIFSEFTGGEVIRVEHMHPERATMEVPLPYERPQMILELFGGAPRELAPALRTVILRPDKELLVCVWVGTMPVDGPPTEAQLEKTRHAVRWKR